MAQHFLSTLTVDPLYTVHWLLILYTLTADPLYIDCWPSLHWLLILYIDCWPSLHCTLTVDPLYIDCWSSLHSVSICPPPPGSTEALTFSHEKLSVDPLHIDHRSPQDQQRVIAFSCESESWVLILSTSIPPPPTINTKTTLAKWSCFWHGTSNFIFFNILIIPIGYLGSESCFWVDEEKTYVSIYVNLWLTHVTDLNVLVITNTRSNFWSSGYFPWVICTNTSSSLVTRWNSVRTNVGWQELVCNWD